MLPLPQQLCNSTSVTIEVPHRRGTRVRLGLSIIPHPTYERGVCKTDLTAMGAGFHYSGTSIPPSKVADVFFSTYCGLSIWYRTKVETRAYPLARKLCNLRQLNMT
jgi:hypothetical protein